jgi:hypothetical protein
MPWVTETNSDERKIYGMYLWFVVLDARDRFEPGRSDSF